MGRLFWFVFFGVMAVCALYSFAVWAFGWKGSRYLRLLILENAIYLVFWIWFLVQERAKGLKIGKLVGKGPGLAELAPQLFPLACLALFAVGTTLIFKGMIHALALQKWPGFSDYSGLPDPNAFGRAFGFVISCLHLTLLCFVGPLAEEMVFRGILLQRLAEKWGWEESLWCGSALFALAHGSASTFPEHFLFGLIMGLIYLKFRSLWMTTVCHGLFNALLVAGAGTIMATRAQSLFQGGGFLASHILPAEMLCVLLPTPVLAYYLWELWPAKKPKMPYSVNRA